MPGLQSVNVVIFFNVASHAETSVLYSPGILYCGAFYAGLLGGSCYVNAYKRICEDLPPLHQEFALSSTSVGESLGIVVAVILGLFIQSCLYQITLHSIMLVPNQWIGWNTCSLSTGMI
jgi:battenin